MEDLREIYERLRKVEMETQATRADFHSHVEICGVRNENTKEILTDLQKQAKAANATLSKLAEHDAVQDGKREMSWSLISVLAAACGGGAGIMTLIVQLVTRALGG